MAMTPRTLAEIREDLIAAVAVADPETDTSDGGDAYITANAIAGLAAELQARDLELSRATLPATATGADLDKHARVWLGEDDARQEPTQWFGTVTINRNDLVVTPAVALGTVLVHADGTQYETAEAVVAADWSGISLTIDAVSADENAGTVANKASATPLTVQAPPAGLSASATIASTTTAALDRESDDHLRGRILDVTAGHPGAGNAADYQVWAKSVSGVSEAFVYPRWDGIGTVTVVPLRADGDHIIPAGTLLTAVQTKLDADRPCGALITAEAATAAPLTVTPTIRVVTGYEAGWAGSFTTSGGPHTTTRVYLTADPTATIEVGDWIVVPIGVNNFSCARQAVDVQTGATHYIDVGAAFVNEDGDETAPSGADTVRPGTSNYNAIIAAIKGVFDRVGPSGSSDAARQRYPAPATSYTPHVYLSDIMAAIDNVTGVVSCDLAAPAANTINNVAPGAAITLATFVPAVVVTWASV